jgi:hypothetical protein
MFTGRPDAGNPDTAVAQLLTNQGVGIITIQSPQVGSIAQLVLSIVNPEIDGSVGGSLDNDDIKTGKLLLGGEEATGGRCEVGTG